jgi:hypothetical protein
MFETFFRGEQFPCFLFVLSQSVVYFNTSLVFFCLIDYFGKSEPLLRQSEPPAKVGWICM